MTIIWGVYVLLVSVIAEDLYWPSCCGELIITGHLKEGGLVGLFPQFPGGGGCGDVGIGFAFITGGSVQLSWVGMLFNQKG